MLTQCRTENRNALFLELLRTCLRGRTAVVSHSSDDGTGCGKLTMKAFDWHADPISRATVITKSYRNTQNVRRFLARECGSAFRFDRPFMAWLKDGTEKTMGDAADEWLRRQAENGKRS